MSARSQLPEGTILDGKYCILQVLGRGGMGVVYLAENVRVRRKVAIKVLSRAATEGADDAVLRFEREAQAAGQIGSEHIVEVLDLGSTEDGDRFMVMELLDGETLKQRCKQGRLDPAQIVYVFRQILDGLEAAHAAGIVHRDLKPDNVFLQREKAGHKDWVKILDFGISKFSGLSAEGAQQTRTGVVMGTPYYMSPEQARAASSVDARSDLYAVGVMLYEMLTGQVPFGGTTLAELMFKIVFEPQPHPKSVCPTLDDELCGIVVRGMAREPSARFQSAAEFRAALAAWDEKRERGLLPPPASLGAPSLPLPPHVAPGSVDKAPTSASQTRQTWARAEESAQGSSGKRMGGLVAAIVGALLVLGIGGYLATRGSAGEAPSPPAPEAASSANAPLEPAAPESPPPAPEPSPEPAEEAPSPTPVLASAEAPSASTAPAPARVAAPPSATQTAPGAPTATTKKVVPTKKVVTDYGY